MANTKNLISFAKAGGKNKPQDAKKPVEKKVEKPLTAEEERDLKAKEKVKELLGDVNMSPKKDDDELFEMETESPKNIEWFTEQITALSAENELLKNELQIAKADYGKIFNENQRIRSGAGIPASNASNNGVTVLFSELQNNYLKYPANTRNETNVNVRYLLNRMSELFPEVSKVRKF